LQSFQTFKPFQSFKNRTLMTEAALRLIACDREPAAPVHSVLAEFPDVVVPGRIAGLQVNMDVSRRILRAWMPAVHAGITLVFL